MRKLCLLVVCALLGSPAWASSKALDKAIDLYESGQLAQAHDELQLLVDTGHLSAKDRIEARLYLAATDLALEEPDAARAQLTILMRKHPNLQPDPAVFSPELVLLAQRIRHDVAQEQLKKHAEADRVKQLESQRRAAQRKAEKEKQLEAQRKADQEKQLEAQRKVDQEKQLEAQRKADQEKQLEAQRKADQEKQLDAQRKADQQKQLEAQRKADQEKPTGATEAASPLARNHPALTPKLTAESPLAESSPRQADSRRGRRTWGYVALGVAGAAATVGAIFALGAKSSANDATNATSRTPYDQAKSDAQGKASIASVSFIAAGLAAAGGGVLIGTSF